MVNDHHAALFQQRLVAIQVEVIAERHHLHQQRIQNRIDVVRRDVRNAGDQDVALALDRNRVLLESLLEDLFVHRLGLAGVARRHLVLRRPRMKQLAARRPRQLPQRVAHRLELHAVERGEVVLVLQQEIHVASVHAIVDGGLDVKDLAGARRQACPAGCTLWVELRPRRIHVAVRIANRLRLVMRAQRFVIAKSDRHRLVAAVHRHEVDVAVDEQVALERRVG